MNRPLPALVVLLLALAVIAMLVLRSNDPAVPLASARPSGPEAEVLAAESAATGLTVVTADAAADLAGSDYPDRVPRDASGATPVLLRVKVRRSTDGSAVPQACVRLLPEFVSDPWTDERLAPTNALGDALFDVPPGRYLARCVYGGQVMADVRTAEAREVELLVPPGYVVEGTVVDFARKPIRDATIHLAFDDVRRGVVVATTDAGGRFKLQDLSGQHALAARHDDYAPSPLLAVRGEPGQVRPVAIQLQGLHGSLHGTVTDAQGHSIARARIAVTEDPRSDAPGPGGRRTVPAPARVFDGDADGTFHAAGLRTSRHLVQARAPGYGTLTKVVAIEAGKSAEVLLQLEKGAQVTGIARDGMGQPVTGVLVRSGKRGAFGSRWTVTDGNGTYLLTEVTAGEVELTAWRSAQERASTTLELEPGKTGTWHPLLANVPVAGVLRGHVVDSRDQPLPAWRVLVQDPEQKDAATGRETDAQGRFVFQDLRPGATVTVKVFRPGSSWSGFPDATATLVRVDGEDLELRVPDAANTWGLLRGRVTTPDGQATPARVECAHTTLDLRAVQETDATGGFEMRAPAGNLDLRVSQAPYPVLRLRQIELQGGEVKDLGPLAFAPPGRITGSVLALDGAPPPELQISLLLDGEDGGKVVYADGMFAAEGLAAGDYRLAVQGQGIAATMLPFKLGAGEYKQLQVDLQRGVSRRLRIVGPAGSGCGGTVSLAVMDAKSQRAWFAAMPLAVTQSGAAVAEFEAWLAPGTYRAFARTGNGFSAAGSVEVGEAAAAPLVLTLARAK